MARANLTLNTFTTNGVATIAPTAVTLADGAMFVNGGAIVLHVTNGTGGALDITFVTGLEVEGFTVEDLTATLGAGAVRWCGPFTTSTFNQTGADAGSVYIDVTGTLDIIAFSIG